MASVLLVEFRVCLLWELLSHIGKLFLLPVVPAVKQVPGREARGFPEAHELSLNLAPMTEVQALTQIPNLSPDLSNRWRWSVWDADAH